MGTLFDAMGVSENHQRNQQAYELFLLLAVYEYNFGLAR
jgi:hypothetical protein